MTHARLRGRILASGAAGEAERLRERNGSAHGRLGAVSFVQPFGSALGRRESAEMVQRYAHLSANPRTACRDRLCVLSAADAKLEFAVISNVASWPTALPAPGAGSAGTIFLRDGFQGLMLDGQSRQAADMRRGDYLQVTRE